MGQTEGRSAALAGNESHGAGIETPLGPGFETSESVKVDAWINTRMDSLELQSEEGCSGQRVDTQQEAG